MPDIARLRRDTPGVPALVHLNNAGCALPVRSVLQAQVDYLHAEAVTGGYEAAAAHAARVDFGYELLARVLGARTEEVGLLQSATDAWQRMLLAMPLPAGAHVVFDETLYGGNLLALLECKRRWGWRLTAVGPNSSGTLDLAALHELLKTGTVDLVAASHMTAISGAVNPLLQIGRAAREFGALTLVDACQTLGQVPLDVSASGIDCLVFTGRKYLRAPRGTGGYFLSSAVASRSRALTPDIRTAVISTGGMELEVVKEARVLETWEHNWAAQMGLIAALEYYHEIDPAWVWERIQAVAGALAARLSETDGVQVRRDSAEIGGIVAFKVLGADLLQLRDWLRDRGCNVMFAGSQNAPLQMIRDGETGWLRASVHYYNDDSDIDRLCELLRESRRKVG